MEGDGDLDEPLERLAHVARRRLPLGFEHLVDLEEEPRVPERGCPRQGASEGAGGTIGLAAVGACRGGSARGVCAHRRGVGRVDSEERVLARLDELERREPVADRRRRHALGGGQPDKRGRVALVVERAQRERGERVAQGEGEGGTAHGRLCRMRRAGMLPARTVTHVYTGQVRVRHDELDCFGCVQPAVYLRYLAQVAVDASTAAGLDAAWYARAGTHWLIRRSTFALERPVGVGEPLEVRTWVEDFRRVRSHRGYEVRDRGGAVCLTARTDWVYVDAATGRPRRIPEEVERAFGAPAARAGDRAGWSAPPPPAAPARGRHRVRYADLDSLGHMNNAAYVDVLVEATLDALAACGRPLGTLPVDGRVPLVVGGDVEYLEAARHGDALEIRTWFSASAELAAHHEVVRPGDSRVLVRGSTRWRWMDAAGGRAGPVPADVLGALGPLAA